MAAGADRGIRSCISAMVRNELCIIASVALSLSCAACGSSDTGDTGKAHPTPHVEASGCDVPPAPDLGALATHTVGSGSAASCTQAALEDALNAGGLVDFDCGGQPVVIAIASTLVVKSGTHLDGGGLVTLDANDTTGILRTAQNSQVIVSGLTFLHGHARKVAGVDGADGSGGAIQRGWQSNLYVKDCAFLDNVADGDDGQNGGAIFAGSAGWLTIVGSTFDGNRAPSGGATHTVLSDLTIVDSVFSGNEATNGDGGAVYTDGAYVPYKGQNGVNDGKIGLCGVRFIDNVATASAAAGFLFTYGQDELVINRAEFSGNRVTTDAPGLGGAIRIDAIAFVANSLFAENQTAGQGGALWMGRGPASFENVTFFGNDAAKWGGAISYDTKPITLVNCTVAKNVAGEGSDGLFGAADSVPVVKNSIFFANGSDGDNRHCRRPIQASTSIAFPASDTDTCGANLLHEDPMLESDLGDHGGFTRTLALNVGSPALGAGTDCPATDQRGTPRNSSSCDLGAFELP
jgi:predicted outer membrane repeat protein